jgi:hypothetical protein
MADSQWDGGEDALRQRLALLPAALAGQIPQYAQAAATVARALGIELLACVKEAFVEKGRGGTGSDGITWKPLSPAHVAYHRRHKGLNQKRGRAAKAGRAGRPLLTKQQDQLWRGVYASCLGRGDDPATAAAKAWGVTKRAGGKTIIGVHGGETVQIGVDTGRLLASLSPGNPDNVLVTTPGTLNVGTNVKYAAAFHARRPLYPPSGVIPPAWQQRLAAVFAAALPEFLRVFLRA